MTPTRWTCDACKATGTLLAEPGAGVMEGLSVVFAAHAAASPDCGADCLNAVRADLVEEARA